MNDWDVVIIGAGPAGAIAAREVARRGAAVLLVDRKLFPRWKVCGACLSPQALATLAQAGLPDLVAQAGAVPIHSLTLAGWNRRATIPLNSGAVLSRAAFDGALVDAAVAQGAVFLPRTQARLERDPTGNHRIVTLIRDEHTIHVAASVVVVANGLGSRLTAAEPDFTEEFDPKSRIGGGVVLENADEFYEPGAIQMAVAAKGYVGIVRQQDDLLNIAAALEPRVVRERGGLGPAAAAILEEAGCPSLEFLAGTDWHGTVSLTRRIAPVACERLFVIGDAAGYVEPFTGEGIAWALDSGIAVAPLVERSVRDWQPSLAQEWTRLHKHQMRRRQRVCRCATFILRRPLVARAVLAAIASVPRLANSAVRRLQARVVMG